MSTITYNNISGNLSIKFPFDLKDAFRSLFKTAKWNPAAKAWEVKATTANENKLKKFIDMSQSALSVLSELDNIEATEMEIAKTQELIDKYEEILKKSLASKERHQDLNARLATAQEKYRADREVAINARNAANAEAQDFESQVKAALDELNVGSLISSLETIWKRGKLCGQRDEFYAVCRQLKDAYSSIKETHRLKIFAVYKAADINFNWSRTETSPATYYSHAIATAEVID
jgi:hypothetical protein